MSYRIHWRNVATAIAALFTVALAIAWATSTPDQPPLPPAPPALPAAVGTEPPPTATPPPATVPPPAEDREGGGAARNRSGNRRPARAPRRRGHVRASRRAHGPADDGRAGGAGKGSPRVRPGEARRSPRGTSGGRDGLDPPAARPGLRSPAPAPTPEFALG